MNKRKERKRKEEKGEETRQRERRQERGREGKHPINIQLITQLIHVIYVHAHPKQDNNN